jgi:NifB/MoaA-like Fe-S oxidoreductase
MSGTQFVFSTEQVERENKCVALGSESDGRSMSTSGKTTESTQLKLKIAQEQIKELQLQLHARNNRTSVTPMAVNTEQFTSNEINELLLSPSHHCTLSVWSGNKMQQHHLE